MLYIYISFDLELSSEAPDHDCFVNMKATNTLRKTC